MKVNIKFPHSYSIIFGLIIVMAILTWILPSGEYEKKYDEATGKELVIAGTYKEQANNPQGFVDIMTAFAKGLTDSAEVLAFVLIIGGSYGVILRSNAIEEGLKSAVKKFGNKDKFIIALLMALFSIGGTTTGMWEETLPFIMIAIPLMLALGFDPIVGLAVVAIGAGTGNLGSIVSPFAVGIASSIASVKIQDGMELRILLYIGSIIISVSYVLKYAMKVKKDPSKSIVASKMSFYKDHFLQGKKTMSDGEGFTGKHKLILIVFFVMIIFMIYAIMSLGWWMNEMTMLFLLVAFFTAIVSKMSSYKFWDSFIAGATDLLPAALVIGLARAIVVVANDGVILDTILHEADVFLAGLPKPLFIVLNEFVELAIAFLVPSSSAHAALTVPITAPLADLFSIPREIAIISYYAASGLANFVTPTAGILMAGILAAKITYVDWIKFVIPLFLIQLIWVICVLVIGVLVY